MRRVRDWLWIWLCLCLGLVWAGSGGAQTISTFAGDGTAAYGGDGSPATGAQLSSPEGVVLDGAGNLYIADEGNSRIRKVDAATGIITTVAGDGTMGSSGDGGAATSAQLGDPVDVVLDGAGNLYIADTFGSDIRKVDAGTGIITTVAGGLPGFGGDGGPATSAQMDRPGGVVVDGAGNIYIADTFNHRVRKVDAGTGIITTVAGDGTAAYGGDGGAATSAQLNFPRDVTLDGSGHLYIADDANNRIRKVDAGTGIITTVAGDGTASDGGDGGLATNAQMDGPNEVVVDGSGHLYIAIASNNRIRKVDGSTGIITTVAGDGTFGFSGDGGPATSAELDRPKGVAVDPSGHIYIGDTFNHRVRKVTVPPADVVVSIPDTTSAYNQSIRVPVRVDDTSGKGIVSAELFIAFSNAASGGLLSVFSAGVTPTAMTAGWTIESNVADGPGDIDTLKIAMATDDDDLVGSGDLVELLFAVADQRSPATSPLSLAHVLFNDGVPGNTTDDGSVKLVGLDETDVTILMAPPVPGTLLQVQVDDFDEDRNSGLVEVVTAEIKNGLQTETMTLTELGPGHGIFQGSLATAFSLASTALPSSGDNIVQVKAGDTVEACFVDSLDGSGNTVEVCSFVLIIGGAEGSAAVTLVSQPGDPVYIEVSDADLNANITSVETVDVTVQNSRTLENFNVTLTEVDLDDAVFFGSLPTTSGPSTATDMNTAEDDVLTVTYVDALTAIGDQQNRLATDDVINPWGDADDNEALQAFDAAQILIDVLSGGTHLSGAGELAANVDLDPVGTGITPYDAALVLKKRVGLIATFEVQDPASTNHPQGNPVSPKGIVDERQLTLRAGEGYVAVWADEREAIVAGDLLLEGLEGRVALPEELGAFLQASRATDEGLRIVFAGPQGVAGAGELVRIYPGVGPENARLVRAQLNDGRIGALLDGAAVDAAQPAVFALHPNQPNPFNPSTAIRFALPRDAAAELAVFDVLGQRIRTLVAAPLPAGAHRAVWDGRDERGAAVGSGVYFYRLQAGEFIQMRRMLLLK